MKTNFHFKVAASLMAIAGCFHQPLFADRSQARSMVISRGGIVATEQPLASQAGAQILTQGGNAMDAAVAATAAMGIVGPMANGMGGDLFAIVYAAKSGKLYGLNASGWAAAGTSIELLGEFASDVGGGQVVLRDFAKQINYGASDPRKDGCAIPQFSK